MLEKGHKFSKGGRRPGAGQPPTWFRKYCDELIRNRKLVERLADIAEGKEIFKKWITVGSGKNAHSECVDAAAEPSVQVYATEKLFDRAWGKSSSFEIEGNIIPANVLIFNFFKILDNLSKNESLRPQLENAIRSVTENMENAELLQDQRQESTIDQPKSESNTTPDPRLSDTTTNIPPINS